MIDKAKQAAAGKQWESDTLDKTKKAAEELKGITELLFEWAQRYGYDYASVWALGDRASASTAPDRPNYLDIWIKKEPSEAKTSRTQILYSE